MRRKNNSIAVLLTTVLTLLSIVNSTIAQTGANRGFDPARLDKTCEPCEDFYKFANGGWLEKNPVPAAYGRWGSFDLLGETNREALWGILKEAAANRKARRGSNEQKIGDFYASCMDEQGIEAAGLKPLEAEFARIEKIKNLNDLTAIVAGQHLQNVSSLFGFGAGPDAKNSKVIAAYAGQSGISLPNREYYTKTDEKSIKTRADFVRHVARVFELLGDDKTAAAAKANAVMRIETKLAEASMTPVQARDRNATYNKMTLAEFQKMTPNLSWKNYFAGVHINAPSEIIVAQPDFFRALNRHLTEVSLDDWKTYLRWWLVDGLANRLPKSIADADFDFYQRNLRGVKEQLPRWRRCVSLTDATLGEALGEVYVARHFTPESKARMQTMVNNLVAAFRERLDKLDWMSDETRRAAVVKLDAFTQKIGYPEKWIDYGKLEISRASHLDNYLRSMEFLRKRNLDRIGKPVDRSEWGMTPPTVNAYYYSLNNEIVFPAGLLQFPFFNPAADDAINYGAIGGVIGHEITHGFDDQGSESDAVGNLRNWWAADDKRKFGERAQCVINQFGGYEVEKGLFMTGKLVQGESIADLGGLNIAFDAFKKSMAGKPRPADIDGFTPEQRFFLGWAQIWAAAYTPEAARLQALNGPHPISRFRVNGPLSNMPEFAEAFSCKIGDPMVRNDKERCQIW